MTTTSPAKTVAPKSAPLSEPKLRRLTALEWDVLLDAANAYEAEPANFEEDPNDKRLDALRSAIEKLQQRIR